MRARTEYKLWYTSSTCRRPADTGSYGPSPAGRLALDRRLLARMDPLGFVAPPGLRHVLVHFVEYVRTSRQPFLLEESHYRRWDYAVQPDKGLGVIAEVLAREIGHFAVVQCQRGGVQHDVTDGGQTESGVIVAKVLGQALAANQVDEPRSMSFVSRTGFSTEGQGARDSRARFRAAEPGPRVTAAL